MKHFLLTLALFSAMSSAIADDGFHTAQTKAEVALDHILKLTDRTNSNFIQWLRRKQNKSTISPFLTKELQESLRQKEYEIVLEDCNGVYKTGEICGLDFQPILCAQDTNDTYVYRTIQSDGTQATVEYAWPGATQALATYKLKNKNKIWQINSISCLSSHKFN